MLRPLTSTTSLDTLRKTAKRWLNAIREGDREAHDRLAAVITHAGPVSLRIVQQALAREYGFESWAALKRDRESQAPPLFATNEERINAFIEHACVHYGVNPRSGKWEPTGYADAPERWAYAASLLSRYPDMVKGNIHVAVVAGEVDEVRRILEHDPAAARQKGGLEGWEPLLRLGYNRLPAPNASETGLRIAELLLANGADPNARWGAEDDEGWAFTVLTGVIGEGEGPLAIHPPHPSGMALAELLVANGAEPYDRQALYNTSLHDDDVRWLDFMERHGRPATTWTETIGLLIERATAENHLRRARWVLTHGDARAALQSRPQLYRHAMVRGFTDVAELLVAHGAERVTLTGEEAFCAAATRLDRAALETLLRDNARLARSCSALFVAAEHNRVEMATLLLDLGVSPDVRSHTNMRPLHVAASAGAVDVAALLIARGAEIDPIETQYGSVPIGGALWHRRPGTLALLAQHSRAMFPLVHSGQVARVRQLLAEDPSMATLVRERDRHTLLMVLPDDEEVAMELAELLLTHGADPSRQNAEGLTVRDMALRRGFVDLADLINDHAQPR
jgi:ankyrin repeat protein